MQPIPPGTSYPPPAKTSLLAIWSLVLGILSLVCFSIFAAIPGVICGHKGLSSIKRSGGALTGQGLAIAGLITSYIGIALALFVIPMMLAIAIPNFVKARDTAQAHACISNLRQIQTAKQQWALEKQKQPTDVPTESDIEPYSKSTIRALKCPAGGTYKINSVAEEPTCSISTHKLQ
jgi:competence protein ComGC